jgi:16S rRNA processing protein RimM
VKPYTEKPESLGAFAGWLVETADGWREMALEEFEVHAKGPVARLAGCTDRTAAERLRGCEVAVPREALDEAGEGELYQVDLEGFEVRDAEGRPLGTVEGFFETGATSVMVVKGAIERLIPFVAGYVKAVDRETRRITVDWKADYDA